VQFSLNAMSYIDYIKGITFRFVKPKTPLVPVPIGRVGRFGWSHWSRIKGLFELVNTRLPYRERQIKAGLQHISDVPRMSSIAIGALINQGVRQMSTEQTFVNVGVWHGFTFLSGILDNQDKRCIAIDDFSQFGGPREAFLKRFKRYRSRQHHFFEMDYRRYFAKVHRGQVGFYVYDGGHTYEDQLEGLQVAEPYFSDGCIILVDDINYAAVRHATEDFIEQSRTSYQVILEEPTFCNYHPTFWNGIAVLKRVF
jgi:hypothetical protein